MASEYVRDTMLAYLQANYSAATVIPTENLNAGSTIQGGSLAPWVTMDEWQRATEEPVTPGRVATLRRREEGTLQFTAFVQSGTGVDVAATNATALQALFAPGTQITGADSGDETITILRTDPPNRSFPSQLSGGGGDWFGLSVDVNYSCDFCGVAAWTPAILFSADEAGAWYDLTTLTTLWQDSAGTTPVAIATDPIGRIDDRSGNSANATQTTDAARPLYQTSPARAVFDKSDDTLSVSFTTPIVGSLLIGTDKGIIETIVSIGVGSWGWSALPQWFPDNNVVGMILRNGVLSSTEMTSAKAWLIAQGSGSDFSTATSAYGWFRGRTDIIALSTTDWDTSSITNFAFFAYECSSMTTLDASGWDTSAVTDFSYFATPCSSLTALDVSGWDTGEVTTFLLFLHSCSSITTLDISGWDTGKVTNFGYFVSKCSSLTTLTVGDAFAASPCVAYSNAFVDCALDQATVNAILVSINNAGTSGGTLTISGGTSATPSATGQTATDALRARGWTVALNGY